MNDYRDDSDRLKPCPFCGGDAEMLTMTEGDDAGGMFVQCTNAMCRTSSILMWPLMDDVRPLLMEKWNRRPIGDAKPIAPLYDTDTPPVGLFALRDVVRCLRETGSYTDDEGEATNALVDLIDRIAGNTASDPDRVQALVDRYHAEVAAGTQTVPPMARRGT